jgi:hypothetical protein
MALGESQVRSQRQNSIRRARRLGSPLTPVFRDSSALAREMPRFRQANDELTRGRRSLYGSRQQSAQTLDNQWFR